MKYNFKHGLTNTRFYIIWGSMKKRCFNPRSDGYLKYGAKGIKVCDKWKIFTNFRDDMYKSYLEHVKEFGEKNTQIERINVMKNYTPENCKWITIAEQARNKTNSHLISFNGTTRNLTDWAKRLNLPFGVLYKRIRRGWPIEKVLTTPKINRQRLFTMNRETKGIYTWARINRVSPKNLWKRLKRGWSIKKALTTPIIK